MPSDERSIRTATPDDAAAAASIRALAAPHLVLTAAGMRARLTEPQTAGSWVALAGDEPVGFALLRRPYGGVSRVSLMVAPEHRRSGHGGSLLGAVEASSAGATGGVAEDEDGVAFATSRGCVLGRTHRFAGVDPRTCPAPPTPAAGTSVVRLAEAGPHAVWVLSQATGRDDPSGMWADQSFDIWRGEDWDFPDHAADLGAGALVDGELVAYTHVFADRDRGRSWSAMTGVLPTQRGRGLARLVKAWSMRWAAAAGITQASTANDAGNAPMLAVNDWLGYRQTATAVSVRRPVAD